MLCFIWVFTICKSAPLGVSLIQRFKSIKKVCPQILKVYIKHWQIQRVGGGGGGGRWVRTPLLGKSQVALGFFRIFGMDPP